MILRYALRVLQLSLILCLCSCASQCPPGDCGKFEGTLKFEWVAAGKMKLLEPFAYVDPAGKRWGAEADYVSDGASIPQVFWSVVGSPFTGNYVKAAVIHDWHCEEKIESWQDVHRAFYHACRCGGVEEMKAKVLYAAVYHFGPRWGETGTGPVAAQMVYSSQIVAELKQTEAFRRMELPDDVPIDYDLKSRQITFKVAEPRMHILRVQQPVLQQAQEELFRNIKRQIETMELSIEEIETYSFE